MDENSALRLTEEWEAIFNELIARADCEGVRVNLFVGCDYVEPDGHESFRTVHVGNHQDIDTLISVSECVTEEIDAGFEAIGFTYGNVMGAPAPSDLN